jgi:hypothetical protein
MAEKHLVATIGDKYAAMSRGKRIKTIQSLDEEGAAFIQKFFPEFYAEAFPSPSRRASGSMQSDLRPELVAKTR